LILFYGVITVIFLAVFILVPDLVAVSNEKLSLELRAAASQRVLALHSRLWPAIISLVCILGVHHFRVFLRVVGPLYQMRLVFKEVSKGNLSIRMRLRKKDYLIQEQDLFNEMMNRLEEKCRIIKASGEGGLQSLALLEKSMAEMGESRDAINRILQACRQHLENLMETSKYFRLTEEKGQELSKNRE